jgi:hypothetical protein
MISETRYSAQEDFASGIAPPSAAVSSAATSRTAPDFGSMALRRITTFLIATCIPPRVKPFSLADS